MFVFPIRPISPVIKKEGERKKREKRGKNKWIIIFSENPSGKVKAAAAVGVSGWDLF